MDGSAHRLATTLAERIEGVEIAFHEAYWDSQVEASPENEAKRVELELELRAIKGDPAALEDVRTALAEEIHDPILRRQLEVLRLSLIGNQMSDAAREEMVKLSGAIESDFASFRPEIDGDRLNDNDIEEVLRTSDDGDERRKVWRASKEVGALTAGRVRELARVRNAAARDLGYADYYSMELELQEISEEWLFEMLAGFEKATEGPYISWKAGLDTALRTRFGTDELHAWHYADPFFQSLPAEGRIDLDPLLGDASAEALALKTFAGWGIDLAGVMERSDLYPRERKCQHAFCLSVDRLDDVRILANVVPGERWVDVMLHESGHAAYDIAIDQRLPYTLRRPTHTFVTEAMALLSGTLVRDPRWLVDVAGVDASRVTPIADDLEFATAASSLLFARWCLVMIHFERDLYADPEADLDERWWELVERFQNVTVPPDAAPRGAWASKIHVAVAPVYYHNYLLGDMLASQLRAAIERDLGGFVGVPEAGGFLRDNLFAPGASLRWDEILPKAVGGPLEPDAFATSVARAGR